MAHRQSPSDDGLSRILAHETGAGVQVSDEEAVWLVSRGAPPEGGRLEGKDAIRAMLDRRFADIPDMAWEIHSHWVGGDRGASEWTVSGTEANGNLLDWLGCDLWRLDGDGRILRKDTYWKYSGGES